MLNLLVRYHIITAIGGGLSADNYVNVYYDDSLEAIEVQKFDDASDTTGTVMTSGPDIGARGIDHEIISGLENTEEGFTFLQYKFCDGTTLVSHFVKSLFPYVVRAESTNHIQCTTGVVCDLQISDEFTTQEATDTATNDGAAEVSATSSHGPIKFSLNPNFDYATQGQLSGIFSGLYAGFHTITAKDSAGCFDQITIEIKVPDFYNPRYIYEYDDYNNNKNGTGNISKSRVEILERGYLGDVERIEKGGPDPFVLKYNGQGQLNKFKSIIPSEAHLTVMSPTNFKFRHLNSQDDRKYMMRFSKNYGATSSSFTPATLPGLSSWTNENQVITESLPYEKSWGWTVGSAPVLNIGDVSSGYSFTSFVNGKVLTDYYYTDYGFVAGRTFSFDYNFEPIPSPNTGYNNTLPAIFKIKIVDASMDTLLEKLVNVEGNNVQTTGNYSFVAPSGAVGIAITVEIAFAGGSTEKNYKINSFDNVTPSESSGVATWDVKWLGFIIGDNNKEAYKAPPYPVTIVATCGLADLQTADFLDSQERRYREDVVTLTAIIDILKKTGLSINVQSAINRFEENMDQLSTDDPLSQCKFDPKTFYHEGKISSCFEVLDEILKSFGARILQRNGKWFMATIEEHLLEFSYREFDYKGNYIKQGTYDDRIDIDVPIATLRAAFINRNQGLENIPAYGKMSFNHVLLKNESLVPSFGFEEEDTVIDNNGIRVLKNWNVILAGFPGAQYGIKETKSLQGEFTFFTRFIDGQGKYLVLRNNAFDIEYDETDFFEFSFEYAILLRTIAGDVNSNPFWVRIKWMLKIGSYYFKEDIGWTSEVLVDPYNYLYVNEFNKDANFKIRGLFRDVGVVSTETVQLEFILEGSDPYDVAFDTAGPTEDDELKAIDTVLRSPGYKVKGLYTVTAPSDISQRYYVLESGTENDSYPDIVRPDDYNGTSNAKYWKLEQIQTSWKLVEFIYIDNVVLLHFPKGSDTPETITFTKPNNPNLKNTFDEPYLLNDIDIDNINNSERTYKNFYKLLDGSPTQVWQRSYRAGQGKLLALLADDFASQYKKQYNKLTGSFMPDCEVLPTSVMTEVNDGNAKYLFMGYELHDLKQNIIFDLLQVADITDEDGEFIDADFNTDFSLDLHS